MQEPTRYNLLSVLQKSFKVAQKKIYLHRIIYIASFTKTDSPSGQDEKVFNILIESNIRLINEEYCEDVITGFGLFYSGYIINIIEGPEESLVKHLKTLVNAFDQDLKKLPSVNKMKVLLVSNHINKRFFTTWNGRSAVPPVLILKAETTLDPEVNKRHIHHCIMKLYKMSEYLRNQSPNLLRATMDNISDLCQGYLPETALLDFLLDSTALIDLRDYINIFGSVPDYTQYYQNVWPITFDFVPHNILKEDTSKKLMSESFQKAPVKEEEEETVE